MSSAYAASPRAAQTLRACGQAGVVGNHARDLLTHAQTARLRNRWRPAPSLEEAAARVASAFRVFYAVSYTHLTLPTKRIV